MGEYKYKGPDSYGNVCLKHMTLCIMLLDILMNKQHSWNIDTGVLFLLQFYELVFTSF